MWTTLKEVLKRAEDKDLASTEIDLSFQYMGLKGMNQLAAVLPSFSNLKKLVLRYNNLGVKSAKVLASVLPSCSNLIELDLYNNFIGAEGAKALADVLPLCDALSKLSLERNNLGDEGAIAIASVLPFCSSLSLLNLSWNKLYLESAKALASVLPQCNILSELNLIDNFLGAKGAQVLARVLPQRSTLCRLYLHSHYLKEEAEKTYQTIESILKVNCQRYEELMKAITQNNFDQIEILHQQGASLFAMAGEWSSYYGYTPLLLATDLGKVDIVKWLLEKDCSDMQRTLLTKIVTPENRGKNALEIAKASGFKEIVTLLQSVKTSKAKKEALVIPQAKQELSIFAQSSQSLPLADNIIKPNHESKSVFTKPN